MSEQKFKIHYHAPRRLPIGDETGEGIYWFQECLDATDFRGRWLTEDPKGKELGEDWYSKGLGYHVSLNAFLIRGENKNLLFDTLSLSRPEHLVDELKDLLGDEGLDYVVPSHDEPPHAGGTRPVLNAFPEAKLVECTAKDTNPMLHRLAYEGGDLVQVTHGDRIDLGGYNVRFVKPVLLDSAMTTWIFEETTRSLYSVDSFGFPHGSNECLKTVEEMDSPVTSDRMLQYSGSTLQYVQYCNPDKIKSEIDTVFNDLKPSILAPAHGQVVINEDIDRYVKIMKENIDWVAENGALEPTSFGGE